MNSSSGRRRFLWLLIFAGCFRTEAATAHAISASFLNIRVDEAGTAFQLDLDLIDLNEQISLDQNGDRLITWSEVTSQFDNIKATLEGAVAFADPVNKCPITISEFKINKKLGGVYLAAFGTLGCKPSSQLKVQYNYFFDLNLDHRCYLQLTFPGGNRSLILSDNNREVGIPLVAESAGPILKQFVGEGLWHILGAIDHVLFLIVLLLPCVLRRTSKFDWLPEQSKSVVVWHVTKVVTSFTVAHTLTLVLTSFAVLPLPPTWLAETLVALTILISAIDNIYSIVPFKRTLMGFVFGLIHGLGYSSVLTDLGLGGRSMVFGLLGFNVGVELAQLVVIGLFLPILFQLRNAALYQWILLRVGSATIGVFSLLWAIDSATGWDLIPF
jgi:hypothetical protein